MPELHGKYDNALCKSQHWHMHNNETLKINNSLSQYDYKLFIMHLFILNISISIKDRSITHSKNSFSSTLGLSSSNNVKKEVSLRKVYKYR